MRKTLIKTAAVLPATLLLAMGMPTSASAVSGYVQDFEKDTAGWATLKDGAVPVTRVASGEAGVTSSAGSHHAMLTGLGAYTRFANTQANQWDGAWSTSTDVYLDPAWYAGTGFDYSVGVNGSDGKHRRDFIIHVAKDQSAGLLVGASNNTDFTVREDLATRPHGIVSSEGWYTMKHSFAMVDGQLVGTIQLLDAKGKSVFTQDLADPSDTLDTIGGSRYGWFTALEKTELAFDNVRVERVDAEATHAYKTSFDGVGITTDQTDRWRMSGDYDAEIVTRGGDALLRVSNAKASGRFGDMLFSPTLTAAADETPTNNAFNASFVIEPTQYQEGLQIQVSPDDGEGGREGLVRLTHENDGLTVETITYFLNDEAEWDYKFVPVATGLDVHKTHTVSMQVVKWADQSDDVPNDVFTVSVDGKAPVKVSTFEGYYIGEGQDNPATDTLLFRMRDTADVAGAGFLIDDVQMSVSTVKATTPVKPTPPVKPTVKPKARVTAKATKAKNKLYVNVNPNQGKGLLGVQGPEADQERLEDPAGHVPDPRQRRDAHHQPAQGHLPHRGAARARAHHRCLPSRVPEEVTPIPLH